MKQPLSSQLSRFALPIARALSALVIVAILGFAAPARADESSEAQAYVQRQNETIANLLRQPASAKRDELISGTLDSYVDYDELTRRAFGTPCPTTKKCVDHWATLKEDQKKEVRDLLRRLVEKNYRKNLIKTLDWSVDYQGAREGRAGEFRVKTEATNKRKAREPSVQVDYVLRNTGGGAFKVVDIVTENSSLTKNYYDQFNRMMSEPTQQYPFVVQRLKERIAKKD